MYVALSTMDKWWYEDMGKTEGVELLRRCLDEVSKRESVAMDREEVADAWR